MKKILLGICAFVIGASVFAQKDIITTVFEKYAGVEGITTVNVSGDMLKLMTQAEMDQSGNKLTSTMSEIRILALEGKSDKPVSIDFKAEVYDKLDKSVYKEMLTVKQTDEDVVILAKESNGRIQELLVIVGGSDDKALIQVKGDMLLSEMAEMAGKYQMKGFEQLRKLDK